jgi:hypothetical protein
MEPNTYFTVLLEAHVLQGLKADDVKANLYLETKAS